jgi:hypothetical protein
MIILLVFPKLEVKKTSHTMHGRANAMQKLHQVEKLRMGKCWKCSEAYFTLAQKGGMRPRKVSHLLSHADHRPDG